MAVFAGQWLLPAQLVLDLATVTAAFPFDVERLIVSMDLIRLSMFPSIDVSMS